MLLCGRPVKIYDRRCVERELATALYSTHVQFSHKRVCFIALTKLRQFNNTMLHKAVHKYSLAHYKQPLTVEIETHNKQDAQPIADTIGLRDLSTISRLL